MSKLVSLNRIADGARATGNFLEKIDLNDIWITFRTCSAPLEKKIKI